MQNISLYSNKFVQLKINHIVRKFLLLSASFLMCHLLQAQVTQINSNKTLHLQFALSDTKGLFVSEVDSTVWVSDGTPAGTVMLAPDIFFRANGGLLNSKFYFAATSAATGTELYSTDGTIGGTTLVKDIFPGGTGSSPYQNFALLNGYLYFSAATAAEGRELWRTDGTAAGTTLVKDIFPGTTGSNTGTGYNILSNGSFLLFGAASTTGDVELWKSDGTTAGTQLLKDINTFADQGSKPNYFNNLGSTILFMANDSTHGNEIWKTDGTTAGTTLLRDINAGTASSVTYAYFREVNGKYFFTADNGVNGNELWATDGTTANTSMIKDIFPGTNGSYATMYNSIKVGTKVIFTAADLFSGYELWESDGTAAGTKILKDVDPGTNSSYSTLMLAYEFNYSNGTFTNPLFQGNKFFFQATTAASGQELWVSDGTAVGTTIVKDINNGVSNGINSPSFFYTTTGLYFGADDGVYGNELWKTDGTNAGTLRLTDINVGQPSADIQLGMVINNKLLFQATNGDAITKDVYRLDAIVTVLPITLTDLNLSTKDADAMLQWSTSCEVNSKNFTIQRSLTGDNFTNIGVVNASVNSCEKRTYNFNDAGILKTATNRIYYKLMMTDKDGKSTYSKTISVRVNGKPEWSISLLQNPVLTDVKVMLNDVSGKTTIHLRDVRGNTINAARVIAGNGQASLDVSNLLPGMYVVIAENGTEKKSIRFVKL